MAFAPDIMILPRIEQIPGESRVPAMLVGMIFPTIITSFFVAGRIISKARILRIWGWDDSLIILSWLSALAVTISLVLASFYGPGHHMQDVPPQLLVTSFKISSISIICYQLTLCLTKLSILFFYLRVFPSQRERLLCWGTIACVICYEIPLLVATVLQCDATTGKWIFGNTVSCLPFGPLLKASTTLHTVTDAWLIIIVLPALLTLQIPTRQKFALIAVIGLGVFVIIASIARLLNILYYGYPDLTWNLAFFNVWTVWECSISIICACAPTIRPLLLKIFPRFMANSVIGTYARKYSAGTRFTRTEDRARTRTKLDSFELSSLGKNNTNSTAVTTRMTQNESWSFENGSEEDIIAKPKGILKSTDYVVTQSLAEGGREKRVRGSKSDSYSIKDGQDGMPHF